jgi:Arc/MetJ-type ribon-helix-helix transcriptional regulator
MSDTVRLSDEARMEIDRLVACGAAKTRTAAVDVLVRRAAQRTVVKDVHEECERASERLNAVLKLHDVDDDTRLALLERLHSLYNLFIPVLVGSASLNHIVVELKK